MLSRRERVTTSQFNEAIASRNVVSTPFATLRVLSYEGTRCAIVVSKKVAKSAVNRNRIRRQVAHIIKKLDIPSGITLIFIKPAYLGADRQAIIQSFTQVFAEIARSKTTASNRRA